MTRSLVLLEGKFNNSFKIENTQKRRTNCKIFNPGWKKGTMTYIKKTLKTTLTFSTKYFLLLHFLQQCNCSFSLIIRYSYKQRLHRSQVFICKQSETVRYRFLSSKEKSSSIDRFIHPSTPSHSFIPFHSVPFR